uniref:CRAL-TRIO domain-containing protein n=1 Tax=Ditylum brightwellii TaxID=49249 RepID=A0A6S9ANQ1_9STRA|mmetsp:Transcript_25598/g.34055  ORF Transcript_25598/g.34055 Transcript_25598/m.34055 type:complete len:161 (+) Transcript_25598:758-1240(+)
MFMPFFRITYAHYAYAMRRNPLTQIRALMYIEEAALEDESVQRKGVIFINYNGNNPTFGQFDRHLIGQWASSTKGCMPIRVSAIYILQIPTLFVVLLNLLKYLLGARLAKRLLIIPGSNEKCLTRLEKRGIAKELLPIEIGGKLMLDQEEWVRERMQAGK